MGGYAVVAIKGYQAGGVGEGWGCNPQGFFFLCVAQLFWFVRLSLHVFAIYSVLYCYARVHTTRGRGSPHIYS